MSWSPSLVCRGSVYPRWLAVLCVAAAFAGCSDADPTVKDSATNTAAEAESSTAPAGRQTQAANDEPDEESWDVLFMQGSRVGYNHATQRELQENGRTLLHLEGESQLFVKRFGQPTDVGIRISSLETPEGQVLSLTSDAELGPQATVVSGQVEGGKLRLQTRVAGAKTTHEIDWPADARGYFAIDQELKRQPMEPGQRRTIKTLQPPINILAKAELAAADYEETELLTGSYKLLRIDCTLDQPGGKLEQTLWADRTGEVMKTYMSAMQITSYRTTKAVALEKTDATFDLGKMSTVKLSKPLADPHQTRKVRYRVELAGEDPAALFVSGMTQQVNSTGPHTAEITVEAIGPDTDLPAGQAAHASPPTDADRKPNDLVQSEDPRIAEMAEMAAGDQKAPWKVAQALESYVHRNVKDKNYSTAFASASEVAETMAGDCTEHAVLLAALARARGIPSRAAIGLVYAPSEQGFAYHMWTEVYVNDRWIPLDATLGKAGIGAAHLKLADSNLNGANAYSSFLPVAKVIGKLKIEVLESE